MVEQSADDTDATSRSAGPPTDEASDGSAAAAAAAGGTSGAAASSSAAASASGEGDAAAEAGVAAAAGSSSTSCEPAQPASEGSGEATAADAPLASEQQAASSSSTPAAAAGAAAAGSSSQLGLNGSHPTIPAPRGRVTTTWHTDKLRTSRELMVYHLECSDEALLGTLVLQPDHKLEDVLRMLRDELEVDAATVSRGTMGSSLKVPVHKNQYGKSALHYFPSKRHCLLVMEFHDGDNSD